jgi:hypothetical protein
MPCTERRNAAAVVIALILALGSASLFAAAGDLDCTFGSGGVVITNLGGDEQALAVGLQSDQTCRAKCRIENAVRGVAHEPRFHSTRSLPANYFTQMSAADFVGVPLHEGDSIMITVSAGSLIAYGATTDNRTNDPSVQFVRVLP